jgi:hypothetical protein
MERGRSGRRRDSSHERAVPAGRSF